MDGFTPDRRAGLTAIVFVGTTFSPSYFGARLASPLPVAAEDFCAVNLALYGDHRAWVLTEYSRDAVERSPSQLRVGGSTLGWRDGSLVLTVDESTVSFRGQAGTPVRGVIRMTPAALGPRTPLLLSESGQHRWWPVAPLGQLQVDLDEPRVRFSGSGYHDANMGHEPIEKGFRAWTWSRSLGGRSCGVLYDVHRRDGSRTCFGQRFAKGAPVELLEAPRHQRLPPTLWLLGRRTRTDADSRARVLRTLENAPFYARTLIETTLAGERTLAMHEALDLDRFTTPIVQRMLPYKILNRLDG